MALNSTNSHAFTIEQIVRHGFRRAGLLNERQHLTQDKRREGTEYLQQMMDVLDADTWRARSFRHDELTLALQSGSLTDYENSYALGSDVVDTTMVAMYIAASETDTDRADSETVIERVPRSKIHQLGSKSATGRPTYFWVDASVSPITVNFWPNPDEAGTVRLEVMHRNQDSTSAQYNLDLEHYFVQMAIYFVAHESSLGGVAKETRTQYLWGQFLYYKNLCKPRSTEVATRQFSMGMRVYGGRR